MYCALQHCKYREREIVRGGGEIKVLLVNVLKEKDIL